MLGPVLYAIVKSYNAFLRECYGTLRNFLTCLMERNNYGIRQSVCWNWEVVQRRRSLRREDYAGGYAMYTFDLTADLGEDDHFSLVRQGNVRLALKFAAGLATTVTVITYAEFENIIEVDRDRNVIFDLGYEYGTNRSRTTSSP